MAKATSKTGAVAFSFVAVKLDRLLAELDAVIVEREQLNRLVFTALLSGQNLFIGGEPGEGKTFAINTIAKCIEARYRYQLFSPDTLPDEFMGKTELIEYVAEDGVKHTQAHKDLAGGLAQVEVFAADEIFKANSPARNAQLGIINERVYQNGKEVVECPLKLYVGMSNELPQQASDAAFWDRLAIRYWTKPVSKVGRRVLMQREAGLEQPPSIETRITLDELDQMRAEVQGVTISEKAIDTVLDVIERASTFNQKISTRKCNQLIHLLKAYAYVCGSMSVKREHLSLLQFVLWDKHSHREQLEQIMTDFTGNKDSVLNASYKEAIELRKLTKSSGGTELAAAARKVTKILDDMQEIKEDCTERDFVIAERAVKEIAAEIGKRIDELYGI